MSTLKTLKIQKTGIMKMKFSKIPASERTPLIFMFNQANTLILPMTEVANWHSVFMFVDS